jgi:urea ABC transporter ATP-binding protein UrtD
MDGPSKVVLETRGLTKRFGGVVAVDNLDYRVVEGQLRCVIGTNGAGKTTLFNLVTGRLKPTSGEVCFRGADITGFSPHRICRMGVGRKFQAPNVFHELSVADNIRVAAQGKSGLLRLGLHKYDETFEDELPQILQKIRLYDKKDLRAASLSHGEQQWLEIGMVLANHPVLLLLDEPTAGMTMAETRETVGLIRDISAGTTTIVIEHDIGFVREIAETVTVMHRGRVLAEGCLDEVECDDVVRDVYLGRQFE